MQRDDHLAIELRERERPGRVDALEERQRTVRLDPRERESRHLAARRRKLLGGDRLVLRLRAVERGGGAAVERGQPAAREVVVHLRPDRLERLVRRPRSRRPAAGSSRGRPRLSCASRRRPGARRRTGRALACVTPGTPLRSISPPTQAMMSAMTARAAASSTESGGMMPSPLNFVLAKIVAVSVVSARVIAAASGLPRLASTCRAAASSCAPSGDSARMEDKGSASAPWAISIGSLRTATTQLTAAMISGARTWPSWSVSSRSSVFESNSRSCVGQLSATQSFWSRSLSAARSEFFSSVTWSTPPARKNFQRCAAPCAPESDAFMAVSSRPEEGPVPAGRAA